MSMQQAARLRSRLQRMWVNGPGGGIDLSEALREPVRYLKLACYPGWVLVEADVTVSPDEVASIDVMYGPGALWVVDGSVAPIHALNRGDFQPKADGPPLAPALASLDETLTGPEYLRFFCGAVWGGEGPFMIVEDEEHPGVAAVSSDRQWLKEISPVSMRRDNDDLVADAVVVYAGSAFRARFRIQKGQVLMEEDSPMAGELALPPRRHWPPLRDLRALVTTHQEA